jgi:serine/threonine protein kinase
MARILHKVSADTGLLVTKLIGKGTFASVYLAEDEKRNQYAVKAIEKNPESTNSSVYNEIENLSNLCGHPNIVKLYRTVETDTYIYLIQECCDKDLFDAIEQGLDELTIRKLFKELCKAVAYCHSKSIYHRDLKPENILIKNNTLKLCDFGLSTTDSLCDEFQTGSVRYMAPEVYCDPSVSDTSLKMPYVSSANDVWALGIILINLLTSRNPWESPSRSDKHFQKFRKNPKSFFKTLKISKELVPVLENAFQNDPFDRPNVEELLILVDNVPFMLDGDRETDSDIVAQKDLNPELNQLIETTCISYENNHQESNPISISYSHKSLELTQIPEIKHCFGKDAMHWMTNRISNPLSFKLDDNNLVGSTGVHACVLIAILFRGANRSKCMNLRNT